MKRANASIAALFAVAALAGCQHGSLVVVTVDSVSPLAVDHLNVQATIGASTRSFVVPLANKTIPPSHSFGVQVADSFAGTFTVHLDAIDPDGNVVGQLDGSVSLGGGGKISLPLTFGAGGGDMGSDDLGGDDLGGDVDLATPCTVVGTSCAGNTLVTTCSDGTSMSAGCALGCSSNGTPHCELVYPTAPVVQSDVYASDLSSTPTMFPPGATVILDAEAGDISISGSTTTVRAANVSPVSSRQVLNGIAFALVPVTYPNQGNATNTMAVWSFNGLTIPATTMVYVHAPTGKAVALVSRGDVIVQGIIDMRPHDDTGALCPNNTYSYQLAVSAGGFSEGMGPSTGTASGSAINGGNGMGGTIYNFGGGGGAGYGYVGGDGGPNNGDAPANRARPGGPVTLGPLTAVIGGSGGGTQSNYVHGGPGGGALQLVSATKVSIAAGGGINLGGCGGEGGTFNTYKYGGAGGGAGGGLLVESPVIEVPTSATLAANGGGGGASCTTSTAQHGAPGGLNATPATAGSCAGGVGAVGGAGGAGTSAATARGQNGGTYQYVQDTLNTYNLSGGGGGSAGSIRLSSTTSTLTGTISPTAATSTLDVH